MSDDPNSWSSNQPRQGDHIYAPGAQGIITNPSGPVNVTYNNQPAVQKLICPKPLAPPDKFGGRDKELDELKGRLKADKLVALTSLNGLGGIGKTTLARQLAHDLYYEAEAVRSFRAVLWVELAQKPDEGRLLENLGKQADAELSRKPDEEIGDFAGRVRRTLQAAIEQECAECGPNRVLLVLDDVWEDGVELARLIQNFVPEKTTVLITTRAAKVAALLGTNSQPITKMQPEEGAALLREFLKDAPQEDLLELSAALDGYTLALKLAAKRLLAEPDPLGELSEHIRQYRKELPAGTEFARLELEQGDKKEENLTKTLFYSYAALEAEEQAFFRALGAITHGQPFDLPMLAALWQLSEEEAKAKAKRLWQLGLLELEPVHAGEVTVGLGAKVGGTRPGWYRLHLVLRSYALALLKRDAVEHRAAIARYQDYVIEVADQFNELPPEEWGQLTAYLPHIHAVGAELVKASVEAEEDEIIQRRALAFARNTTRYLFRRREVREVSWLEMGLNASRRLQDQKRESLFLSDLGLYYSDAGEKSQAIEFYEQSLVLKKATQDQAGEATTLSNLGAVYDDLGDKDKAIQLFEQALPLRRAVGDRSGEAYTLSNLGKVYSDLGDKDKAILLYEQALPLLRAVGDRSGEATTLSNLGKVYSDLGDKDKAIQLFEQALPLRRAVGDKYGEAITLNNIGMVLWQRGEGEQALKLVEQAQALLEYVRSPDARVIAGYAAQMRTELQGRVNMPPKFQKRSGSLFGWLKRKDEHP